MGRVAPLVLDKNGNVCKNNRVRLQQKKNEER